MAIRSFRDQPIAHKALLLGITPTLCAVLLVTVAFLVSTFFSVRSRVRRDIETSAAMIADNVEAALAFSDRKTAYEAMTAVHQKPNIDRVCVFDARGQLFAWYTVAGETCTSSTGAIVPPGSTQISIFEEVRKGPRHLGTVRVIGNLHELYERMALQMTVSTAALAIAVGLALLLIGRMQRALAEPIGRLASTADRISSTGDFSLRAQQLSADEVGSLVRSFNEMLTHIERAQRERADLLQREREASRLKDEFLAAVSHELRTPLNAILGWTQILTSTKPSADMLERGLRSLDRNAKAQARLIEDLIEVSRIATGKLHLRLGVVELRDVIRQAIEVAQPLAAAKKIAIDTDLPTEPSLVTGDRDRLQQVVSNLLHNAVKFTPAGGRVFVSLSGSDREFVIVVRDTGVGITSEFLPHVFERFRQADGSTTREHAGLGLGLAIAQELVQLHQGSIRAQSEGKDRGATFTVHLPMLVEAAPPPSEPAAAAEPLVAQWDLSGVRILAVDDNRDALELLASALARTGADVRTAHSGMQALEEWRRGPAQVLLLDLAMPEMDGFEVLERIRALPASEDHQCATIAVTAYASPEYIKRTQAAGFAAHVLKPIDVNLLLSQIAWVVGRAGEPQASK
jgi:signal transduction histidine kinase/ActR/RegA family two-component response regulator